MKPSDTKRIKGVPIKTIKKVIDLIDESGLFLSISTQSPNGEPMEVGFDDLLIYLQDGFEEGEANYWGQRLDF